MSRSVCHGLEHALARFGVPGQILTDNGKVSAGKRFRPPVEVLLQKIMTAPYPPTDPGKVEGFRRWSRFELLIGRVSNSLPHAHKKLDAWAEDSRYFRSASSCEDEKSLEVFAESLVVSVPVRSSPESVFRNRGGM